MEQKVNHSIPVLKQKFFSLIQENRYSEQYRYYLRLRFTALETYMSQNSCHDYSPEIGEQFISDFRKINTPSTGDLYQQGQRCLLWVQFYGAPFEEHLNNAIRF